MLPKVTEEIKNLFLKNEFINKAGIRKMFCCRRNFYINLSEHKRKRSEQQF
jgi:hypothetical protein